MGLEEGGGGGDFSGWGWKMQWGKLGIDSLKDKILIWHEDLELFFH